MNIKELAEKIGCHRRTIYKMSKSRQQQWQALAAKEKTISWFDVIGHLMFEVESFNASKYPLEQISLSFAGSGCATVGHYDEDVEAIRFMWVHNIDQLTEALRYVRGLNNNAK